MRTAHASASLANQKTTEEDGEGEKHVKHPLLSLITWAGCRRVARARKESEMRRILSLY